MSRASEILKFFEAKYHQGDEVSWHGKVYRVITSRIPSENSDGGVCYELINDATGAYEKDVPEKELK